MSEIPWWVWALAGAAVPVLIAGRRRATTILSAVLLGGAAVAALLRAFLPPAPRDGAERLAAVGVLPPSGFAAALLLTLGTAVVVLLAVFWPPRRLTVLRLLGGASVAVVAALLAAGPLADATADRIAASEVDSIIAEPIGTIRHDATPTGPGPGARELWSGPAWRSAHLVPGSNLVVLAGRGVEVARADTGTPLWHYNVAADTRVAVDVGSGRIAVIASRAVVLLDLATGRQLNRIVLPGGRYWEPVPVDHGEPLTGPRLMLASVYDTNDRLVITLDLDTGAVSEVDRAPRRDCRYTLARGTQPVLVRDGDFCGQPQLTYLTGGPQRVPVPLAGPTDACALGCRVNGTQSTDTTLAFQLIREHTNVELVVIRHRGRIWRRPTDDLGFTLLPGDRLLVERDPGDDDVLDQSDGAVLATGVPVPGTDYGLLLDTGWYRLIHDQAATRLVVVDPVTLQQVGPPTPVPPGSSLVNAADGRLLVTPPRPDIGSGQQPRIIVLGNP